MGSRLFTLALAIALTIVTLWWQLAERRARLAEARIASVPSLRPLRPDSAAAVPAPAAASPSGLEPWERERLQKLGFADPERVLRQDLARHPELIPYHGVEGGTMGFYDTSSVQVLGGRWVLGRFEDGHVQGRGIFAYDVGPRGRITWTRVVARMDDL